MVNPLHFIFCKELAICLLLLLASMASVEFPGHHVNKGGEVCIYETGQFPAKVGCIVSGD